MDEERTGERLTTDLFRPVFCTPICAILFASSLLWHSATEFYGSTHSYVPTGTAQSRSCSYPLANKDGCARDWRHHCLSGVDLPRSYPPASSMSFRHLFAYNSLMSLDVGGYHDRPDWPRMGPSLLIATCLIVAIRTAKMKGTCGNRSTMIASPHQNDT